jgi:chloride channel protein, CIC family
LQGVTVNGPDNAVTPATTDPRHSGDSVSDEAVTLGIAGLIGVFSGLLTAAFLLVVHFAEKLIWHNLAHVLPGDLSDTSAAIIGVGVLAVGIVLVFRVGGRPTEFGHAEREYAHDGRLDPKTFGPIALWSVFSLASGAVVGPEAPLIDLSGQLGTFLSERLGLRGERIRVMTYAAVAGAFGGFFGSAPVGAIIAMELLGPHAKEIDKRMLLAGLVSGAMAYEAYVLASGSILGPIFVFPEYAGPRFVDAVFAIPLGVLGGFIGIGYLILRSRLGAATRTLRARPVYGVTAGAVTVAIAALVSPYLLFSGQSQVELLLTTGLRYSAIFLITIGIAKILLSAWHLSTAYFGGPIFPLMFSGACFGLAVHQLLPAIPTGVAVLALMAALVAAAVPIPLSVTIFLGLVGQPNLISVIAIAAAVGYLVRVALIPRASDATGDTRIDAAVA